MGGELVAGVAAAPSGAERSISLTPLALLGALSSAVALLAQYGVLPSAWLRPAAAYLLLLGFALPGLARWSPPRPALSKLLLFACLLSPLLATALWLVLHAFLPAEQALGGLFVAALLLQASAVGRRARVAPPGNAFVCALVFAALSAAVVGLLLFRGNAPRVSYHGLLHSSLVFAVDRSVPPENPWLAGTGVAYYWFWHGMGALFERAFRTAPTFALAVTNLWAAATVPLSVYFLAAPFVRRGAALLLAVVLAVLGLNLLGGFVWLGTGAESGAPSSAAELFLALSRAVPKVETAEGLRGLWDYRLAFGFSKFGNLSSYPAALALALGGLAAAAHALRNGARPWPGLTGLLVGGALLVNPVVGGIVLGVLGLSALLFPGAPGVRGSVLTALVLGSLPGLVLVVLAGRELDAGLVAFVLDPSRVASTFGPVLVLLLPVPLAARLVQGDPGRRALFALLLLAAVVPLALHLFVSLPEANEYKLIRLAAFPLGVLAAAGASAAWTRGPAWRAGAALWTGVALFGLVGLSFHGLRSYLAFAGTRLPIEERALALLPAREPGETVEAAERSAVYGWLRAVGQSFDEEPVLVLNPRTLGPDYGAAPGQRFNAEPNLQGHEAAAFSGLVLWCDRRSYMVEHHPLWASRLGGVDQWFLDGPRWDPAHRRELASLGRPVILLVTGADRRAGSEAADPPDFDAKAEHHGFLPVGRLGEHALFASPAEFAQSLAAHFAEHFAEAADGDRSRAR